MHAAAADTVPAKTAVGALLTVIQGAARHAVVSGARGTE
jgi:hypothetical protein